MEEVKQQILFPQIRSYLKLYTTIGLEKIARFNDLDEEQFSAQLVSMKHKLTQVWTQGRMRLLVLHAHSCVRFTKGIKLHALWPV